MDFDSYLPGADLGGAQALYDRSLLIENPPDSDFAV
jgi:hypothetical protein